MANSAAEYGGKALVRRSWEEVYTAGNLDAVEEVFDTGCVSHDPTFPGGVIEDAIAIKGNIRRGHAAFENWRFEVNGLYEDGDHVISRVTMHGRHVGEFLGIPASGAEVTVTGITINRINNGKIAERWGNWDTLGMLQQLGALPRVKNVG